MLCILNANLLIRLSLNTKQISADTKMADVLLDFYGPLNSSALYSKNIFRLSEITQVENIFRKYLYKNLQDLSKIIRQRQLPFLCQNVDLFFLRETFFLCKNRNCCKIMFWNIFTTPLIQVHNILKVYLIFSEIT